MESNKEEQITTVSEENIYKLNGRVPLRKAIPFGLQHVLAMFVSNLAPVLIVCSAAFVHGTNDHLTGAEITQLLQWGAFKFGGDYTVIAVCDVCSRNRNLFTVISDWSDRIRTSDYYGSQFYVSWKSVGNCNESESWI